MAELVTGGMVKREFHIPQRAGGLLAQLHRQARVLETTYEGDFVRIVAVLPARLAVACESLLKAGGVENLIDPTIFTDKLMTTG
jgi:GTP-binding protein HflX